MRLIFTDRPVCRPGRQTVFEANKLQTVLLDCNVLSNPKHNLVFVWSFNNSINSMDIPVSLSLSEPSPHPSCAARPDQCGGGGGEEQHPLQSSHWARLRDSALLGQQRHRARRALRLHHPPHWTPGAPGQVSDQQRDLLILRGEDWRQTQTLSLSVFYSSKKSRRISWEFYQNCLKFWWQWRFVRQSFHKTLPNLIFLSPQTWNISSLSHAGSAADIVWASVLQLQQAVQPGGVEAGGGGGEEAPDQPGGLPGGGAPVRDDVQGVGEVGEQTRQEWPRLSPGPDHKRANKTDCWNQSEGGGGGLQRDAGHHHRGGGQSHHHDRHGRHRRVDHQVPGWAEGRPEQIRLWYETEQSPAGWLLYNYQLWYRGKTNNSP